MAYINLYNVLYKMPALKKEDMLVELEELAEEFVNSGLLRIDAEPMQNFTRFSLPTRNVHIVFSHRELYEDHLRLRTYNQLYQALFDSGVKNNIDDKIDKEIEKLKNQLKKHLEVLPHIEMQIARILVQSTHPVNIKMIILEEVQVFVSYGQNIGEVMDVVSWQQVGANSGMQSTDGRNVAIFISCGGDPLFLESTKLEKSENETHAEEEEKLYGDGIPALARMMGIAGQEIGHYSDIIHDNNGRQIGRHSADFSGTKADHNVNLARITDMNNINALWNKLFAIGLGKLIDKENEIKFYKRNPNRPLVYYFKLLFTYFRKKIFIIKARKIGFSPIEDFINKDFVGIRLYSMLGDMMFNLAPVADVYKHSDKNVETAIACIEALARVPQQANKWGHKNTRFLWRNLYKFYYFKVIPNCVKSYEKMSGKIFTDYPNKMRYYSLKEKLKLKFNFFKQKLRKKIMKK